MEPARAMSPQPQPEKATEQPLLARPLFVEAEQLFNQMKELSQNVAQRAYEFFEARGRQWGRELDDWFRAEAEMVRHVPVEINDQGNNLIVRAAVPGFKPEEIKVSVEPQRLVVSGKTESKDEKKEAQTIYTEWRANQFCRALDLPNEIDPAQSTAALKDGVLELTLPKVAAQMPVQVAVKAA